MRNPPQPPLGLRGGFTLFTLAHNFISGDGCLQEVVEEAYKIVKFGNFSNSNQTCQYCTISAAAKIKVIMLFACAAPDNV